MSIAALAGLTMFGGQARADSSAAGLHLIDLQNSRIQAMARTAIQRATSVPFEATFEPTGQRSIVLPSRGPAYTIDGLRTSFPEAFAEERGFLLMKLPVVVAQGATLTISGPLDLRLASGPNSFASIAGVSSTIRIGGGGNVSISSWSSEAGRADDVLEDGRAFVLMRAGEMDVTEASFHDLGFGTGETSGVAWKGAPETPSTGNVVGSRFEDNYFGAYTFQSERMQWTNNVFANNVVYGFDPHDYSNHFVVEGNEAFGNGKHGIIFSRGCSGNVITGNVAHDNGWHGIVIDDGTILDDGNPIHAATIPSTDNVISNNRVFDNQLVGIALEGGNGNVVRNNVITGGRIGIRLKDNASANLIQGNTISGSALFGVYVYKSSGDNDLSGNRVSGGKDAFVLDSVLGNRLTGNVVDGVVGHAVALIGDVGAMDVTGNSFSGVGTTAVDISRAVNPGGIRVGDDVSRWDDNWLADLFRTHPLLALWIIVLLVPMLLSAVLLLLRRGRWVHGLVTAHRIA